MGDNDTNRGSERYKEREREIESLSTTHKVREGERERD